MIYYEILTPRFYLNLAGNQLKVVHFQEDYQQIKQVKI